MGQNPGKTSEYPKKPATVEGRPSPPKKMGHEISFDSRLVQDPGVLLSFTSQ